MIDLNLVLKCLNDARKVLGKEPLNTIPKGVVGSACLCPVAQAFDCEAVVSSLEIALDAEDCFFAENVSNVWGTRYRGEYSVVPPPILADFIEAFDDGKYPELVR